MPFLYEYTLDRELDGRRERITGRIGIRRLGCEQSKSSLGRQAMGAAHRAGRTL